VESVLANAPASRPPYFLVPRIVGGVDDAAEEEMTP
jgi:hypothetical protein